LSYQHHKARDRPCVGLHVDATASVF